MSLNDKLLEKIHKAASKGKAYVITPGYGNGWRVAAKSLQSQGLITIRENGELVLPNSSVVQSAPTVVQTTTSTEAPEQRVSETTPPAAMHIPIITNREVAQPKKKRLVERIDNDLKVIESHERHPAFQRYREYVAMCVEKNEEPQSLVEFTGHTVTFAVEEVEA